MGACSRPPRAPSDVAPRRTPAGVLLRVTEQPYAIRGATADELRQAMRSAGPVGADGRRYYGQYWSTTSWQYRYEQSRSGCTVRRVTVAVEGRLTMPTWTPAAGTDSALVRQWAAFRAALLAHELGHEAITLEHAGQIVRTLDGLNAPTCEAAGRLANDAAQRIRTATRTQQAELDAATRHGATTNAVWPPPRVRPPAAPL